MTRDGLLYGITRHSLADRSTILRRVTCLSLLLSTLAARADGGQIERYNVV